MLEPRLCRQATRRTIDLRQNNLVTNSAGSRTMFYRRINP